VRANTERLPFARAWRDLEAPPPDLVETFARTRYLVGPPWQYAVLLRCIADQAVPSSTSQFLELAASARADLAFFSDAYFAHRELLARDPRWYSLVRPYAEPASLFVERVRGGTARILSTRDARSIQALCAHHLGVELEPRHMLPRAGAREKWQLLLEAADVARLAPERVFFVDDYLHHALPACQHGVRACLATWGYLGPDDISDAGRAGLPCVTLDTFRRALLTHEETST
jgi:hypothetical protein